MRAMTRTSCCTTLALILAVAGCSQAPPPELPSPAPPPAAEAQATVQEPDDPAGESAAPADAVDTAAATDANDEPAPVAGEAIEDPAPASVAAPAETNAARPRRDPKRDPTVIPIESAGRKSQPRSLWEASTAARAKRADAPRARISIRDDNLQDFQDGKVTIGEARRPPAGETEAGAPQEEDAAAEPVRGEEHWRASVLDLRLRLRAAVDDLAELEERAASLRRSFYAQDDPFFRDGEIKPAWDRTLDRIEETRRDILQLHRELAATLEEGREAGALPGWLREGAELEPTAEELPRDRGGERARDSERIHEAREPSLIDIEEQEPPR